jgi:hypothetical protein
MATINQLVRQPRKRIVEKKRRACAAELPAASWRVHSRVYHYAEET